MSRKHDAIIIGAGPAGLSAAIYLARARKKVAIMSATGLGRTGMARHIQNYLGHDDISGNDLLERGKNQAERYGAEFIAETVVNVKKAENGFFVETKNDTHETSYVIVATGITDVMPAIDNLFEYLGETFFHCFDCDGWHLKDKSVCVIGAGDGSARTALAVRQIYTESVTLCAISDQHISDEYRKKLTDKNIPIVTGKAIHIEGQNGIVEKVILKDGSSVRCDRVLSDLGYTRNDDFLNALDVKRSETGYVETDMNFESSLKGMFVIGPLNTGPDQVSVAVGEGARAAMEIIERELIF